jgi:hypothetical protein
MYTHAQKVALIKGTLMLGNTVRLGDLLVALPFAVLSLGKIGNIVNVNGATVWDLSAQTLSSQPDPALDGLMQLLGIV